MDWRYYILKKTGYSFYSKETAGKTLEFIGTSGVGKTTLFRASVASLKSRWFLSHHTDRLKRKAPPGEIDEILMRILKVRIESILDSESFCSWHSFIDLQLSVRVMRETMLVFHDPQSTGFAFDEGLFRHFPAEILQQGDEFPAQLWKNRAFVYLRARMPETALARLKSRKKMLAQQGPDRVRTDDLLLSRIMKEQEIFDSILDKGTSLGCPVLVIDIEDPFQESVDKVLEFETTLGQRFSAQENMERNTQFSTLNR